MTTAVSSVVQAAQDGIIRAIKGRANIVLATRDAVVRGIVASSREAAGTDGIDVLCRGAVRGAALIQADCGQVAKGVALGVLGSSSESVRVNLATASRVAQIVLREVVQLGGDFAAAATGLVAGAIESAPLLEVSAEAAATAAAEGCLKAAQETSATVVEAVRRAVTRPINGLMIRLPEPEPNRGERESFLEIRPTDALAALART